MAGKVIGSALGGFIGSRSYAAAAAATKPAVSEGISFPKQDAKITTLPNGLIVASVENYSPITRIGVFVKAGPRYEQGDQLGAAHALRNAAGISTKNATIFGITRHLEYVGSNLSASATRENIIFELECNRDQTAEGIKFLSEVATKPVFNPWEISSLKQRMLYELADLKLNPTALVLEALHKASYRGGLSNSLYSPKYMVGKHSQKLLQNYVAQNLGSNRTAIVGLGIEHGLLLDHINKQITLDNSTGSEGVSKFQGGEVFINAATESSYAAIVAEGAGLKNTKDALALGVLQQILGAGPRIKYSDGSITKLGAAAAKATSEPFAVSSINLNYSDSGLFGLFVAGNPKDMTALVKSVVKAMRDVAKSSPSAQDLSAAKQRLKATVLIGLEPQSNLLENLGNQLLATGGSHTAAEVAVAIDAITAQDVAAAAAKIIKGKAAMAAYGQLQNMPHLEEL